jgi:hypothetical protein
MSCRTLAPITIGIISSGSFEAKGAEISASLKEIFDRLDARLPLSPKILVTSLAGGPDILAAHEVLERKEWKIVAPLPMPLDLYMQDFDELAATKRRNFIEASMARGKLRLFSLAPLLHQEEQRPLTRHELAEGRGLENPHRTDHLHQAGFVIADQCAILIAVMQASVSDDDGGSISRIVNYRLSGNLDGGSADIFRRSLLLLQPPLLDVPRTGPIWLIDPTIVDSQRESLGPKFQALVPEGEAVSSSHRLRKSLQLVERIHEFNMRTLRLDRGHDNRCPSGSDMDPAPTMLYEFMDALSAIQTEMKRNVKRSVSALAVLFCVGLVTFEAELDLNQWWGIFGYIGALVIGMAIYKFAWMRKWQPFAQDYRAVAEAFRVQIAWWNCGLVGIAHRVDRFYLRNATGSLGLVRAAARQMINAAALVSCRTGSIESIAQMKCEDTGSNPKLSSVEDKSHGARWIEEQCVYFSDRINVRRTWVSFIDSFSWFLLVASLGPEILFAIESVRRGIISSLIDESLVLLDPGFAFLSALTAIPLMFAVSSARWLSSPSMWMDPDLRVFEKPSLLVSAGGGLILAFCLYCFAAYVQPEGGRDIFLVIGGVAAATVASAMQFFSDQLSWSAELRGYEDALEVFRRAKVLFHGMYEPNMDSGEQIIRRKAVIEALGIEALKENESWLRTHRERPLEPLPPA